MSEESKKPLQRIRTFASDLNQQRQIRKKTSEQTEPKPEIKPIRPVIYKPKREVLNTDKKPEPVVDKPEPKPERHRAIPAFHELQKKVDGIQSELSSTALQNPAKKIKAQKAFKSPKTSSPARQDHIGYDATVITDTKKTKINFFTAIALSMRTWLKKVTTPKKKPAPKYTIPEASHRKGVIQQATTKSGSIFTADSDTLKEKIRHRQQADAKQKLEKEQAEKLKDEAETSWSPYTEAGFNLLEMPDPTSNVKLEFKKQPSLAEEAEVETDETSESVSAELEDVEDNRWTETEEVEEILDEDTGWEEAADTIEDESEITPVPSVAEPKQPNANQPTSKTKSSLSFWQKTETNTLAIIILVSIISIIIVIVVSRILFQTLSADGEASYLKSARIDAITKMSELEIITLNANNIDHLPKIIDDQATRVDGGLTEIALISPANDEIGPSYIFELLDFNAPATLKQAMTSTRFVVTNNSEEVILIKFLDETTVKGSFLSWEKTMASDFKKMYNTSSVSGNNFTDGKILGFDVRKLKSGNETQLIYSLIDENTALIAANEVDLIKIIELEFSK